MNDAYTKLKALMEAKRNTEVPCGRLLSHAVPLLVSVTPSGIIEARNEDRNTYGSTDFVVSCRYVTGSGLERNVAYIWEVKAPQCYVFERDRNNQRFIPTKDLLKAENQLIHYCFASTWNAEFKDRFGLRPTDEVKPGGVIIGTDERFAKDFGRYGRQAADQALEIRTRYFYSKYDIRVYTWNRILSHLAPAGTAQFSEPLSKP